ncbi:MAG: LicD family protein [Gammaproteobacteria bacterium]|nr:LicD family protein [Gammaproteobacteria bacterium]
MKGLAMQLVQKNDIQYYTVDGLEEMQETLLRQLAIVDEVCRENGLRYWLDGGTLIGAMRHGGPIPWDDDMDICVPKDDWDRLMPLLYERCKTDEERLLFFYPDNSDRLWAEYFGSLKMLVKAAPGWLPVRLDIAPMKMYPNTQESIDKERAMSRMLTYCSTGFKYDDSQPSLSREQKAAFRKYYYNEYAADLMRQCEGLDADQLCVNNFTRENTNQHHLYSNIFPLQDMAFGDLSVMIPAKPEEYLGYYDDWRRLPDLPDRCPVNERFVRNEGVLSKQQAEKTIRRYYSRLDERVTLRGRVREMLLLGMSHGPAPVFKRVMKAWARKRPIFR